jgi:hypothetical protein
MLEGVRRIALAAVVLSLLPTNAFAKAEKQFSYGFDRVWPSALRLLRVDEKATIVEKDEDAGYILFSVQEKDKELRGSMELVKTKDSEDRDATKVLVSIPGRPDYVGDVILDHLRQKLHDELGDPPAAPKKDPPPADDKPAN